MAATFRYFDGEHLESTFVRVPIRLWEEWGRPVSITAEIRPGPVFVTDDGRTAPAMYSVDEDPYGEPTVWRSTPDGRLCWLLFRRCDLQPDARQYWPEIVARLTGAS